MPKWWEGGIQNFLMVVKGWIVHSNAIEEDNNEFRKVIIEDMVYEGLKQDRGIG